MSTDREINTRTKGYPLATTLNIRRRTTHSERGRVTKVAITKVTSSLADKSAHLEILSPAFLEWHPGARKVYNMIVPLSLSLFDELNHGTCYGNL